MEKEKNTASAVRRQGLKYTLILCAAGTVLNIVGARAALFFGVPLFLDCIGTMITAMLGGYIPGIAVGYLTNIINGISDPTTAYYGTLGVLIAVSASYLYRKGVFKKLPGIICGILIFTLIGGGLGSVLTWLLYGFSFGSGISAPLAHYIHDSGAMGKFMSQFTADMLIDAADKTVSVLVALLIIRLIPERVRPRFFLAGWKQSPNCAAVEGALKQKFSRSVSLRSKVLLMVGISALIVAVSATALGCILYNRSSEEDLIDEGRHAAILAAGALDPRDFEDIASLGDRAERYSQAEAFLCRLMSGEDAIERICIFSVDNGAYRVILSTDAPGGEGRLPGDMIPFSRAQPPELFGIYDSGHTEPVESKDRDGRHVSLFEPVYDSYGRVAGCACVDVSMRQLAVRQTVFLTKVVSLFLGFFILTVTVCIWLAEYNVILPINAMSLAAGNFAYNDERARESSLNGIKELEIVTGDEIEHLYLALCRTTEDTVRYIADSQEKREAISHMQNGLITVLADMVESRDKSTGDHVRKTAAYANIIMKQLKKDDLFKDVLTDEFMENVSNFAPLHDVGKINIPDALLNKPGRLTDDEFARMKEHTSAGGEIIARAIGAMSSSDYLDEAKNLASYHHERWDGKGYPNGLSGEDIPLSARIMAVADVFDALVSRRSYKEPFSFDNAMQIIMDGSGSHFDPRVTRAFMEASEEVRRVAEELSRVDAE